MGGGRGGGPACSHEDEGARIVVHEVGEDGGREPVREEELAEGEARDEARDDLPQAPRGRMGEPEDRGAPEEDGPRGEEGLFRRRPPEVSADEVSEGPREVASRPGLPPPRAPAPVQLEDPRHEGPDRAGGPPEG